MLMLMLVLVLDPSPREAKPFTRITRRCRAVRSLPLAPSSVPLIPSLQVRGLYRKERTDHGRQPARVPPLLATPARPFSLVRHPESRRRRGTSPMV